MSRTEFLIHLKLAPFSQFFPKVFNVSHDKESELIIYEFEEMDSFINELGLMTLFNYESATFTQRVFDSLRFSLHCAYGLFILHKIVGYVHSDISPNNIMFSKIDKVWKIIDFDQSAPISDSKTRSRVAGTEGYVLPASLESGIFTEESDIYSLGKVLYNHIYFTLLGEYVEEFEAKNPLTLDARNVFLHFENIVLRKMSHSNPERIIKIETLIKDLVILIERLKPFAKIKYEHDPVFSAVKLLLEDLKGQESSEKALESELIKRAKISTETKEGPISLGTNVIQ
jgi:serine/threonine protein kinase